MITWGVCSAAMMLTRGAWSFYTIRFLLGIAEAGFFPGIVYYLMHWIPQRQRARSMSVFLTSTATSGVIGTPLAGALMKMDGMAGLHGWQWLFLLEGIPPVLLGMGILALGLLPERPADAAWLAEDERDWIEGQLEQDGSHQAVGHIGGLRAAAMDSRLWLLSAIYFMLVMGLYGFVYWVPTLIKRLTEVPDAKVGLLAAIPYLVGAGTMVVIGKWADGSGRRQVAVAVCALIGAAGLLGLCASGTALMGIGSLCVAAIGIFGTLGPFWAIPTRYLRGRAAAGGIAVINSGGAIAGYVAPKAIGSAMELAHSPNWGLGIVAAALTVGAGLVMCVPGRIDAAQEEGR
jgi:ACS family tartrate transporter-like MFS transporter